MDIRGIDSTISSTSTLEETESPRKRMRLETSVRKSWSLTDRRTDQEVLQEMGVSLLEQDESDLQVDPGNNLRPNLKRKRDIENVNPNVNLITSPRSRHSPKSPRSKLCSPNAGPSRVKSPKSGDKVKPLQPTDQQLLEMTILGEFQFEEETPLAQSVSGQYRHDTGIVPGECTNSGRKKRDSFTSLGVEEELIISKRSKIEPTGIDCFAAISDEVMLSIFKWLPKRTIAHCMLVCKRWHRVACDETLWQRLDLGNKTLSKNALGRILDRKPVIVRLASSEIGEWLPTTPVEASRIQYLDLSMSCVDNETLQRLLYACPLLVKLSLENITVVESAARAIGHCTNLETLNLTMAQGLTANSVSNILQGCHNLLSLNISWCNLDEQSLEALISSLPQRLQRLNISGARIITDENIEQLTVRCPRLVELDSSDCPRLKARSITAITELRLLEHLALSRCYLLPAHALTKLSCMPSLQYLEVWGMLQSASLSALRSALPGIQINQFMFSAIARPTVGTRRTSIWGLRTRD